MRNFAMEQEILEILDEYRAKLPKNLRPWLAITAAVDLSRNAAYDIINSEKEVRRDTVVLLGLALEMSLEDFLKIYHYKGFLIRDNNKRDQIVVRFFRTRNYDHRQLCKDLKADGEMPPFNFKRPIE